MALKYEHYRVRSDRSPPLFFSCFSEREVGRRDSLLATRSRVTIYRYNEST